MSKLDASQNALMKESNFIEQNKEKWKHFEQSLLKKATTPQEVSKLFVQITDDLSYARTFYDKRSVKLYLNGVAKLLFNNINKTKKNNWSVFASFWKKDLPIMMFAARRQMLISFVVFWLCFGLGVITSIYEPDFARTILGDAYIEMTNKNIEAGDPMNVYADSGEMETFLPILLNNLRVAFNTFFFGVFASIGSLVIMMYNGVMVGVFQFFFIEKGLFWESFLSIWTHGTIEISAIIMAGGAGIMLGKGLLFPKTYSRFQAFKMSGKIGLKIILGISPIIFLAAFIEGFLTRHTDIPDFLRLMFILLSFAFIMVYFVWFPRRVAKTTPNLNTLLETPPVYSKKRGFNANKILSVAEIFSETLRLFFKNIGSYLLILIPCSLIFSIAIVKDNLELFYARSFSYGNFSFFNLFNYSEFPATAIFSGALFIMVLVFALLFTRQKLLASSDKFSIKKGFFNTTVYSCLLCMPIFVGLVIIGNGWFTFLAFLLLPMLILITCVSSNENISFFSAVTQIGGLLNKSWGKFLGNSITFLFLVWLFFISTSTVLNNFIVKNGILWSLTNDEELANSISIGISAFLVIFSFITYLVFLASSSGLLYFTLKEAFTAKDLLTRIKSIKAKK